MARVPPDGAQGLSPQAKALLLTMALLDVGAAHENLLQHSVGYQTLAAYPPAGQYETTKEELLGAGLLLLAQTDNADRDPLLLTSQAREGAITDASPDEMAGAFRAGVALVEAAWDGEGRDRFGHHVHVWEADDKMVPLIARLAGHFEASRPMSPQPDALKSWMSLMVRACMYVLGRSLVLRSSCTCFPLVSGRQPVGPTVS